MIGGIGLAATSTAPDLAAYIWQLYDHGDDDDDDDDDDDGGGDDDGNNGHILNVIELAIYIGQFYWHPSSCFNILIIILMIVDVDGSWNDDLWNDDYDLGDKCLGHNGFENN